jgi:hypothetical protein
MRIGAKEQREIQVIMRDIFEKKIFVVSIWAEDGFLALQELQKPIRQMALDNPSEVLAVYDEKQLYIYSRKQQLPGIVVHCLQKGDESYEKTETVQPAL